MGIRAIVFGFAPGDLHRAGRTQRSLAFGGATLDHDFIASPQELCGKLTTTAEPLLLLRAGVWLARAERLAAIRTSATGRSLVGFGAMRHALDAAGWNVHVAAWRDCLVKCGGDLDRRGRLSRRLPEVASCYLESRSAHRLAVLLEREGGLADALSRLARDRCVRAVHLPALDVYDDPSLRVLQLVTTIQIGGAERVTLDLAEELERQGVHVCVAAFGRAIRLAFPEPKRFVDLSTIPNSPEARAAAVADVCREFAADIVHAHLIRGPEACAIKARGLPLVITVHNVPPAWPPGFDSGESPIADLLFACSRAVEAAIEERGLGIPTRTVWNGIDPKRFAPTAERANRGASFRAQLGWRADDFVVVAVANPRPQKRLDRLPRIVYELQALIPHRTVRLLVVGAHRHGGNEAEHATAAVQAESERWQVADRVHWAGAVEDVAGILAASNVLVSTSAYEGLSLAHLEALAAGLPVVATNVGGAREIARQTDMLHLLPSDADGVAFAQVLARIATAPAPRETSLPASFTRYHMTRQVLSLYPRAIERARVQRRGEELWLITNNFSTGGAQSSARRLLSGLFERGIKVRAFTIQEHPKHPTAGRAALLRAGIPVTALMPPVDHDPEEVVAQIRTEAAVAPPQAVLFWNLITSYKILLADGFLDVPVFDVSPGEMYFDSLAKYFAQPRPGLPYFTPSEYGARLRGVVIKHSAEAAAAAQLGSPVRIIANGVPLKNHLHKSGAHRGRLVIGTAARLAPQKRLEDLLEAVRLARPRLPRFVLRIAGGAEVGTHAYARRLRRLARGLPVKWCGELRDMDAFFKGLDLFAMISEPAGCPNASLEAMAAGLPVIATDVGGAREQVLDGVTGRLVPRRNAQAFANALVELGRDPATRQRFGAAGRDHIHAHFSLDQMIENYARLCSLAGAEARGAEVLSSQFSVLRARNSH